MPTLTPEKPQRTHQIRAAPVAVPADDAALRALAQTPTELKLFRRSRFLKEGAAKRKS